jgi:hypothetical protein
MGERTAKKRIRTVSAKPGHLVAAWGRGDDRGSPAIHYAYGGEGASKPDARILCNALEEVSVFAGKSLAVELEARGYDITTLRFSIQRKAPDA